MDRQILVKVYYQLKLIFLTQNLKQPTPFIYENDFTEAGLDDLRRE